VNAILSIPSRMLQMVGLEELPQRFRYSFNSF